MSVQLLDWTRIGRIATGVKMGMSAGMVAHHSWGFAARKAAATSMAATKHKRIAILSAQERTGRSCMDTPLSAFYFILCISLLGSGLAG
jgi:hypothetical protein